VGFPDDELTSNERVVLDLHPHWKQMVGPWTVLVVVVAGLITALVANINGVLMLVLGVIGLILVAWLTVGPFIRWRTTHYVVTNERIITRAGILRQHTENIPIDRISDVKFDQSLFQRVLGCGMLTLSSPGEHAPDVLNNIPHIKRVVATMHDLIHPDDVTPLPSPPQPQPRPAQDGRTQQLNP
jgi:membrane protein YdbS with pleckstrin-like domain